MITWIQTWPLLALPSFIGSVLITVPTFNLKESLFGGGPVREWLVNSLLLPVLPDGQHSIFSAWWLQASVTGEWLVSFLLVLNVNALFLPVIFLVVEAGIRINNWFTKKDLHLKRSAVR